MRAAARGALASERNGATERALCVRRVCAPALENSRALTIPPARLLARTPARPAAAAAAAPRPEPRPLPPPPPSPLPPPPSRALWRTPRRLAPSRAPAQRPRPRRLLRSRHPAPCCTRHPAPRLTVNPNPNKHVWVVGLGALARVPSSAGRAGGLSPPSALDRAAFERARARGRAAAAEFESRRISPYANSVGFPSARVRFAAGAGGFRAGGFPQQFPRGADRSRRGSARAPPRGPTRRAPHGTARTRPRPARATMEGDGEVSALVCDNGSGMVKGASRA